MEQYLEIGQVVSTHGVRGTMKVKPLTDDIKRFNKLKTVYMSIKEELVEFKIQEVKYNKNMVLLNLEGIDSIEKAEEYKNFYLKIDRKDAVKLPKDSYFVIDLLGCNVYTEKEELLGMVDDVYSTGSNDVYVVKDSLGKLLVLPATKEVVKEVNVESKKIIVELIEGLV